MIYRQLGNTGSEVSIIGLGGHEYLADGSSRGFNENLALASRPGHIFPGFGQEGRRRVLAAAFEQGINFFDATQDSEKEALGRNLQEITPPYEIYIQTRPEGMVYGYDPGNRKMAQYELLKAEVQRGLKLLRRERLDFLNIAFLRSALDDDPDYLAKIAHNVRALKKEGLIRFACADTFSGEYTYLRQIKAGCFDAIYINFNLADYCGQHKVFPAAQACLTARQARGMGIITREAFMKGALFQMGPEAGLYDRNLLARAALKWNLSHPEVSMVIVGLDNPAHLANAVQALDDLAISAEEQDVLARLKTSETYKAYQRKKRQEFGYG